MLFNIRFILLLSLPVFISACVSRPPAPSDTNTEVVVETSVEHNQVKDVSNAVISIRESKLPDPKKIGNSGSFFKNPIISKIHLDKLLIQFEDVPNYLQSDGSFKIAAGWLIEQLSLIHIWRCRE